MEFVTARFIPRSWYFFGGGEGGRRGWSANRLTCPSRLTALWFVRYHMVDEMGVVSCLRKGMKKGGSSTACGIVHASTNRYLLE